MVVVEWLGGVLEGVVREESRVMGGEVELRIGGFRGVKK